MDLEDRVDKIDEKLSDISEAVVRIETKMEERAKFWGKGTVRLIVAVGLALLGALGINIACTEDEVPVCVDAGVMDAGMDAGDGGE